MLDFDIIGTLIFLWFIFNGFKSSKKAKKNYAERQKNEPRPRTAINKEPKPVPRPNPVPKSEQNQMPSWFPFPLEIPNGDVVREIKKKVTEKSKVFIPDEIEEPKPKAQIKSREKEQVAPTVIEAQEKQWQASEGDFSLDQRAVVNGMIWSEILGPPRSKKKFNYR